MTPNDTALLCGHLRFTKLFSTLACATLLLMRVQWFVTYMPLIPSTTEHPPCPTACKNCLSDASFFSKCLFNGLNLHKFCFFFMSVFRVFLTSEAQLYEYISGGEKNERKQQTVGETSPLQRWLSERRHKQAAAQSGGSCLSEVSLR